MRQAARQVVLRMARFDRQAKHDADGQPRTGHAQQRSDSL
jgi:hypothetical protein